MTNDRKVSYASQYVKNEVGVAWTEGEYGWDRINVPANKGAGLKVEIGYIAGAGFNLPSLNHVSDVTAGTCFYICNSLPKCVAFNYIVDGGNAVRYCVFFSKVGTALRAPSDFGSEGTLFVKVEYAAQMP